MPRAPKLTTRLVKLKDACAALGCGSTKFWTAWHAVFTDPRPPEERKPRFARRVYEDELAVAVNEASRGKAAVLMFRKQVGRL